jgi:ribosome small subunit-dependent GTPase A
MSSENETLNRLGWSDFFEENFAPYKTQGLIAGRVTLEFNQFYRVSTASGEILAETAGKLRHEAASRADLPAVGDWVALRPIENEEKAVIIAVLPRRSKFARKTKGAKTEEQIVGANIDTVFLVTSLNQDFNARRIERSLTIAWNSGASPVLLLSKADLCSNLEEALELAHASAAGAPLHIVCAISGDGLDELAPYFQSGKTTALIGSSGVGKSTLINALLGFDRQTVKTVRAHDDRGNCSYGMMKKESRRRLTIWKRSPPSAISPIAPIKTNLVAPSATPSSPALSNRIGLKIIEKCNGSSLISPAGRTHSPNGCNAINGKNSPGWRENKRNGKKAGTSPMNP